MLFNLFKSSKTYIIPSFLIIIASFADAQIQEQSSSLNQMNIPEFNPTSHPMEYRYTYEEISIPDKDSMGVVGVHTLFNFTPNWYGGLGVYGAVRGESGGYFAMSLDGGYQHQIWDPLWIDIGNSLGAGGGMQTPVGGGLYVEPYAGLSWHFTHMHFGAYYSHIKFVNGGEIDSSQAMFTLAVPFNFDYQSFDLFDHEAPALPNQNPPNYLALLSQMYFPHKSTTNTAGETQDDPIDFVGIEFGHFMNENVFSYANISGAFHGQGNGYANALIGLGWRYPLFHQKRINFISKLGVGAGGGGSVDTGGGFIYQPTIGVEFLTSNQTAIQADIGYLSAPGGDFDNNTIGLSIKRYLDPVYIDAPTSTYYKGWRIRLSNLTYFDPANQNGGTNDDMQLMNLNLDYWLTHRVYLTGQVAFAYEGESTGGYFSGLVGPGYQLPMSQKFSIYGEMLAGTAGGAGLDISDGALVEPLAGINYQCNNSVGLQASVGQLMAIEGGFNSTVLNFGVTYSFATS